MRLRYYISVLIPLTLLLSCNKKIEGWQPISDEFDRINGVLDSLYFNDQIVNQGAKYVAVLDSMAASSGNQQMKIRVNYWKAVTLGNLNIDSTQTLIYRAMMENDSVADPYTHARLVLIDKMSESGEYMAKYSALREAIKYFADIHDDKMTLMGMRKLSTIYLTIGDYDHYLENCVQLEQFCKDRKWYPQQIRAKMNFAVHAIQTGDSVKAAQILEEIMQSKYIAGDSVFLSRLFVNLGSLKEDPTYLQQAIDTSPKGVWKEDNILSLQFVMAQYYEKKGEYIKADSMLEFLSPLINDYGDNNAKAILNDIYSERAEKAGDYKDAIRLHKLADSYRAPQDVAGGVTEIVKYDFKQELSRLEADKAREKTITQLKWWIGIFIVLLILTNVWFFMHRKAQKLKLAKAGAEAKVTELDLSLEKEKRRLTSLGIAVTQTDYVVNEISETIDEMAKADEISEGAHKALRQRIRSSEASKKELQDFRDAYEKVHPQFVNKLKQLYPQLSEGDIRLCLYISIGLDTKQIANVMHLQPDSIKKNRQRLRKRMQIDSTESLEDILRSI